MPVGGADAEKVRGRTQRAFASVILQYWASALATLCPCRVSWRLRTSLRARDSLFLDSNFFARASVILDDNICLLRKWNVSL